MSQAETVKRLELEKQPKSVLLHLLKERHFLPSQYDIAWAIWNVKTDEAQELMDQVIEIDGSEDLERAQGSSDNPKAYFKHMARFGKKEEERQRLFRKSQYISKEADDIYAKLETYRKL